MQGSTELVRIEDGLVVERPRSPLRRRLIAMLIKFYAWLFGTAAGYRVRFWMSVLLLPWAVSSLFFNHWMFTLASVTGLPVIAIETTQLVSAWRRGRRWFLDNWSERMDYVSHWLFLIGVWIL